MPTEKQVLWITGASMGIGAHVATLAAEQGWTVAASARSKDKLQELAAGESGNGRIQPYPVDVTDRKAVTETVARIERDLGEINRAVLNAGTHADMPVEEFDAEACARIFDLNLSGTANCVDPLLERFLARGRGHLGLVASVAGYRGLPRSAAYCASKAGVIAFAESLASEVGHRGIKVQVINPGFVRTPLTDKNPFPMPYLLEPDDAARRIWRGLEGTSFEVAFPKRFTAQLKLLRNLPYPLYFAAIRKATGLA
ncbi:MAG: SDR family NAD(P)-dependent oxidoreductase [Alphaproteobacteria bacterium]